MSLVINPSPSEAERAAIIAALGAQPRGIQDSAWWRSGIEEALGGDSDDRI